MSVDCGITNLKETDFARGIGMDVIITDHAPHHADDKEVEYNSAANGIVGLETSFALSYTELVAKHGMPIAQLVEKMSVRPHEILGI